MKKIVGMLLLLLLLVGCSSNTLGKKFEVQEHVTMSIDDIEYKNGYVYVTVGVDGSDLNAYPTFVIENFTVEDTDGEPLKYMQLEYGKNSFESTTGLDEDNFAKVVSVEGKGGFKLMFNANKDKSKHYQVTYEIDDKTQTWQN